MKNNLKALTYVVCGNIISVFAGIGIISICVPSTFFPTHVENQIARCALCFILAVIIIFSVMTAGYGAYYLSKKLHKRRRR